MLNKYILSIDISISMITAKMITLINMVITYIKKYKIMILLNKQATIPNESTVYNDNKQ